MKKLFAFKNIQQLLKLDTPAAKTRAKELSLENNFVTDLTSLVIPNQRDEDVRVANLGETGRSSDEDWGSSRLAYSGIQTTSLQFGSNTHSNLDHSLSSSSGYGTRSVGLQGVAGRVGRPRPRFGLSSISRDQTSYKVRTTPSSTSTSTTTATTTTTTRTTTTATPTAKIGSNCSIALYEGEYHAGTEILVTENVPDLSTLNFEDKVQSVKIEGWCKWIIYSGKKKNLTLY